MDTVTHANGTRPRTLADFGRPLELPAPRLAGPVMLWPRQQDTMPPAAAPARDRHVIDGDTAIRWLTAAVVLAVATFAAVVSYSHIYALAHRHGQDGTAARLLPLSIDGLIAAASLVMLHAGRNKLPVPRLARGMLWTGIAATVAANMLYAIPAPWIGPVTSIVIGAAISAFPAVAFIGAVEMMIRFVRDARSVALARPPDMTDDGNGPDTGADKAADTGADKKADAGAPAGKDRPQASRARKAVTGLDKAADILRRNPGLPNAEVAKRAGVSEKTVQRARQAAATAGKLT